MDPKKEKCRQGLFFYSLYIILPEKIRSPVRVFLQVNFFLTVHASYDTIEEFILHQSKLKIYKYYLFNIKIFYAKPLTNSDLYI